MKISIVTKLILIFISISLSHLELSGNHYDIISSDSSIYYIDPFGSDNKGNGSKQKPWASLSFACSKVRWSRRTGQFIYQI